MACEERSPPEVIQWGEVKELCIWISNMLLETAQARSSPPEVLLRKGILKKYGIFREAQVICILLLLLLSFVILPYGRSPVYLLFIFRVPFLKEHHGRTAIFTSHIQILLTKSLVELWTSAAADLGWKLLTIITKRSILDIAVALDQPPLGDANHLS